MKPSNSKSLQSRAARTVRGWNTWEHDGIVVGKCQTLYTARVYTVGLGEQRGICCPAKHFWAAQVNIKKKQIKQVPQISKNILSYNNKELGGDGQWWIRRLRLLIADWRIWGSSRWVTTVGYLGKRLNASHCMQCRSRGVSGSESSVCQILQIKSSDMATSRIKGPKSEQLINK